MKSSAQIQTIFGHSDWLKDLQLHAWRAVANPAIRFPNIGTGRGQVSFNCNSLNLRSYHKNRMEERGRCWLVIAFVEDDGAARSAEGAASTCMAIFIRVNKLD